MAGVTLTDGTRANERRRGEAAARASLRRRRDGTGAFGSRVATP